MRKLFLMLGAPASGKDYWIEQHHLQNYAITPDVLRTQFTTPAYHVTADDQIATTIQNASEQDVWQAVRTAVFDHLKRGSFAIVNATNLFKGAFRNYNQDRITYHYQVYVIDTMAHWFKQFNGNHQAIVDQLVHNDQQRPAIKQVGRQVIDKYVTRYENLLDKHGQVNLPNAVHYVDAADEATVQQLLDWQTTDMSTFNRIKIIGDVHGDYDALQTVFADHQKGDAYIFVGDYLDRGTKSPEVFKFVTQTLGGDNLFFIKGNHETGWEKWETKDKLSGQFSYDSLPKLRAIYDDQQLKKLIRQFAKNWRTYVKFDFNEQTYFVSHAGVEPFMTKLPGETLDDGLFVEGIGPHDDPYARDIDRIWNKEMPKDLINVHGHRNSFQHFADYNNSFNLTADDKFRWLMIDADGIHPHEIDRIDVKSFTQALVNEEHIKQTPLADGIVANNFDREAFRKNIWNDMTVKARGLFTRQDQIVGRGFNKFFQIGQTPDAKLETLQFPVTVEKKWNGFLAVTFWDQQTSSLRIYSKGGGDKMSQLARDILTQTGWTTKLRNYYLADKSNQETTVLFEAIDPINDPHIVKYDRVQAHPLAIINNTKQGTVDNLYASAQERATWPASRQQLAAAIKADNFVAQADNLEQLNAIIRRFETETPNDEGLVFYAPNKMLKYKSKFYLKAKELRGMLERGVYTKQRYYYGAQPWARWCQKHDEHRFSPQLALNLYELEKAGKLP